MKYANYDKETNKILGFYDDEIHSSIPEPNIKISGDEWKKALSIGADYIQNGELIKKEPKIDEKAKQLAQLEAGIKECEDDIKHALIIGNTAVLESLRAELKALIVQREGLKK
ncbi:hypothetical protein [uncultured Campylobacter sp.]|uniref:hypothetical protein n=1 Tax=uncultured Campylobacter sp. TaxID=218934 RepID=UPI0015BF594C|nr:hypothetical protein [uncultured Campylobacter sp.]